MEEDKRRGTGEDSREEDRDGGWEEKGGSSGKGEKGGNFV